MAAFLDIFGFLSVLLRGLGLALEALTVGGVIFVFVIANPIAGDKVTKHLLRWLSCFSLLLALTQLCTVAANSAILIGSTDLPLSELLGASFWTAGCLVVVGALTVGVMAKARCRHLALPFASVLILGGCVMGSHSMARLEHRPILIGLTLLHHLSVAAWMGGLLYLLLALRQAPEGPAATAITERFSRLAIVSVVTLVGAGAGMSWFYVGSVGAMIGTTYGIMLSAKMIFTLILLGIGLLNFKIVQAIRRGFAPRLICLRCFGEAEIGIGFTVILVAASLTSTAPAIDVVGGRVSPQEIAQRMKPQWPRMKTPSVADLSSATPLPNAEAWTKSSSVVRGKPQRVSSLADIAWSEYNHHWAGLVVLTIGLLALLAHPFRWARHWPLVFLALAVFLLIRADSENWPLGPRGFWESFQVAEVAQHRFFVLLIVVFALFEWSVRAGNSLQRRARLVFPLVCAAGGALLMTHSHSLGNVKEEFLAELSHIPIAIFAVAAGWSRWMEIRVPDGSARITTWIWPVCFALIGAVLMLYREA